MGFSDLFSRRKEKKERELYGRPGAGGASLRVDTSRYGSGTEPRSRAPTRRYTDAEPERKHKAAKSEPRRQNTVQTRRAEYEIPRRHKTGTPPHSPQHSFKSPANISTRRKPVPRYADVPIHSPKPRKPPGWFVPPVVYYDDKERSRSQSKSRHGRRESAW
ncbi:hypothetical protein LTR05_005799 [Lithohypha guttulata]|uniref:Uncharacterized protein n=1 Tax=Lithohypha guttulata TaxID=1690604 RepID=A0AAN7SZF3_9EURO|nr:hypothetical protein LTR05_005799 [Lithohypha guttulata]